MNYLIGVCNFTLDPGNLRAFWRHLDSINDAWAAHSIGWRHSLNALPWPLGLYGDDANIGLINSPYSKVFGLWMSVVLYRPRSTRLSRFLLFSIEQDKVVSVEATIYPVLELIKESCNRLTRDGVHGIHCVVSEVRGDQLFFRYLFKHSSWWKSSSVCFRCKCNTSDLPYTNYDGWQATARTTEAFIEEELPEKKCHSVCSF